VSVSGVKNSNEVKELLTDLACLGTQQPPSYADRPGRPAARQGIMEEVTCKEMFRPSRSRMETEHAKLLLKTLPGVVLWQWARCGRAGCRCARGQLHGPYAYRFFRQGNRLRKVYVPKALVDQVAAACNARRAFRRQIKVSWQEWRDLLADIREAEAP
jgi:hypothetical protein